VTMLGVYDLGDTTVWACRADPRFSFLCRVPDGYAPDGASRHRLIVAVHGSRRRNAETAAWFTEVAQRHGAVVLAPLFPAGIAGAEDESSYKLLHAHGLRYDAILLAMVDQAAAKWRIDPERFLLFGFSGGAHFAHRFLYARPDRVAGVSIAAPGVVTLPDERHDWWVGVRDMRLRFGHALDRAAIARVPVHAVVGAEDTETWEITIRSGSAWAMPGDDLAGPDRPGRLAALVRGLRELGADVLHETVPGVAHRGAPLAERAAAFFDRILTASSEPGGRS
jgi:predicted esterase